MKDVREEACFKVIQIAYDRVIDRVGFDPWDQVGVDVAAMVTVLRKRNYECVKREVDAICKEKLWQRREDETCKESSF